MLAIALVGRVLLLASGSVSFHSDEAVVGLMARHILQGERPVFFYGQAYMGSLDAWLIAVGFKLLGESVLTIRVVESILYLLVVVAADFAVAWRISGRVIVAAVAALVLAVPNVLLALYTTATLGGYNETLLFGNLILLLGWDVTHEHRRSLWRWALLGLCAGLGWWTNGLIVAYALPVAVLILVDIAKKRKPLTPSDLRSASPLPHKRGEGIVPPRISSLPARVGERVGSEGLTSFLLPIVVALIFFLIGSAPWWVFNFQNDFAALALLSADQRAERLRRHRHRAAARRSAPDRAVPARLARRDRAALSLAARLFPAARRRDRRADLRLRRSIACCAANHCEAMTCSSRMDACWWWA